MALPLDFIERVRESNDIVEVVREYFPLKRAGQNYKALCPFHSEKTPSFFVSPSKQIFHCFGCGEGGDVIGFVMKIENISFYEAVKKLAERAGIPVPHFKEEPEEGKRRKIILGILKKVAVFYSRYFWESKKAEEARKYMLEERGVKEDVLKEFLIGYAPKGNVLVEEAGKSGFDVSLLEEAGVVVYRVDRKRYEDRFSNRIIFPIRDPQGRVIGFGGRILGKGEPKYLNSPETKYFHKSKILYNFDKAKEYALKENSIIITEGYMDVIGLWQVGIKNVVATMGTAFTSQHVRNISRFVEKVYLLFDPDFAGKEAVLRSMDLLLKSGLDVKVVINETEMDPDEIAREKGISFLRGMIKNGMDLIGFRIKEAVKGRDINSIDEKVKVAKEVLPSIKVISDLIRRKDEIKRLSEAIKVNEEILWLELKKLKIDESEENLKRKIEMHEFKNGKFKLEEETIAFMLKNPKSVEEFRNILKPENFDGEYHSLIVEKIFSLYEKEKEIQEFKILDLIEDEDAKKHFTSIIWNVNLENINKEGLFSSWKREILKKEFESLKQEIENRISNSEEIPVDVYKKFQEVVKLLKKGGS